MTRRLHAEGQGEEVCDERFSTNESDMFGSRYPITNMNATINVDSNLISIEVRRMTKAAAPILPPPRVPRNRPFGRSSLRNLTQTWGRRG